MAGGSGSSGAFQLSSVIAPSQTRDGIRIALSCSAWRRSTTKGLDATGGPHMIQSVATADSEKSVAAAEQTSTEAVR